MTSIEPSARVCAMNFAGLAMGEMAAAKRVWSAPGVGGRGKNANSATLAAIASETAVAPCQTRLPACRPVGTAAVPVASAKRAQSASGGLTGAIMA
jgi:hypothetical protein